MRIRPASWSLAPVCAILILRDVLAWQTDEVADTLGTTRAAVNSALQRARAQLVSVSPDRNRLAEPSDPRQRALLDEYATAFANADIDALTKVLTEDAVWEMPPIPTWFAGRGVVGRFLSTRLGTAGDIRLTATAANGQPAFAVYTRDRDGVHRPHGIHVLRVTASGIAHVVAFHDPQVFARFEVPSQLPERMATIEGKRTC
jgi:RNA polymerase sigma-70 factor (ECF subfamily)